jgi:hypothetical protein
MPTSHHTTISAASNPRVRHTDPKPRAPLTAAEQREKREARAERQDEIDTAVGEWFAYTYAKAEELAQRFKKNQRYFLDVFFQGGAHMIHYQEKVNPYNAFKSEKAAECRESACFFISVYSFLTGHTEGNPMRIDELHDNFHDEYLKLSDDEKAELIERFRDIKTRDVKLRRSTPRGRIQDLASTVRNMQLMVCCTPCFIPCILTFGCRWWVSVIALELRASSALSATTPTSTPSHIGTLRPRSSKTT